jgi:hypothetical protein
VEWPQRNGLEDEHLYSSLRKLNGVGMTVSPI